MRPYMILPENSEENSQHRWHGGWHTPGIKDNNEEPTNPTGRIKFYLSKTLNYRWRSTQVVNRG